MERFVLDLAHAQQRAGCGVLVIALRPGALSEEADARSIPTAVINAPNPPQRIMRCILQMRRFGPDIVHAHNETSLHYAAWGKALTGARLVMTDHGIPQHATRRATTREIASTDRVVAVSEATARLRAERFGTARIDVIRNGVTPSPARASRESMRRSLGIGDEAAGLMVARIDGRKGHTDLIRAAATLRRRSLHTTLLIAGDGAERAGTEALARELGLPPETCRFLGYRSDISDLLAAADFFLLPSLSEGLPMSVLEAMVAGLPVIVTPVGGVPELVIDGVHGIFVPVNDPDALAGAIERLASSPELRHRQGEAARIRVENEFTFRRMTGEYFALYERLLRTRVPVSL